MKRILVLLLLILMLTACVSTSDHKALQAQVSQMNRQMSTSQTSQADSWTQLIEVRQEVAELKGQIDTLHMALQKVGGAEKLADNFNTLMNAVMKAKPAAAKGQYVRSCVVASTMGPGIKINAAKFGN